MAIGNRVGLQARFLFLVGCLAALTSLGGLLAQNWLVAGGAASVYGGASTGIAVSAAGFASAVAWGVGMAFLGVVAAPIAAGVAIFIAA